MDNTYLLTLNQVHSAVERYTTDALFARKLKCKPGFVQRGAVCQPMNMAKGVLGGLGAAALAGGALAAGELTRRQSAAQGRASMLRGIGKGALAGGGVGLLAGVGSGLNDELQKSRLGLDDDTFVSNARNRNIVEGLATVGGAGAGALTYNRGASKTAMSSRDRWLGTGLSGLAGGAAASVGYDLGRSLTRMAGNALRKRDQRNMLPLESDDYSQAGLGTELPSRQKRSQGGQDDYLQVRGTRDLPPRQGRLRGGPDRDMFPPGSGGGGVLPPGPRRPLLPSGSAGLPLPRQRRAMALERG